MAEVPKGKHMRAFVEKAFETGKVNPAAVKRLTDADLQEIAEKAFTKAAVDKDLDSPTREAALRDVLERAYTKASVDKDLPELQSRLSSADLTGIADKVFGKK